MNLQEKKIQEDSEAAEQTRKSRKRSKNPQEPETYFNRYAKILGEDSGVDAAKATRTNAAYGMGKMDYCVFAAS